MLEECEAIVAVCLFILLISISVGARLTARW